MNLRPHQRAVKHKTPRGALGEYQLNYGGDGNDSLYGGIAFQWLLWDGRDYLVGGEGSDYLSGGAEPLDMYGQGGDDSLDAHDRDAGDYADCGDGTNDWTAIDRDLDGGDAQRDCERIVRWR